MKLTILLSKKRKEKNTYTFTYKTDINTTKKVAAEGIKSGKRKKFFENIHEN